MFWTIVAKAKADMNENDPKGMMLPYVSLGLAISIRLHSNMHHQNLFYQQVKQQRDHLIFRLRN